ncbi:MAG TPA: hypothetical protein DEG17_21465 [Cyanobacteria bacterium UBA11149]|nr:hypothetical protein [Cyanobacteria bacterium UBA11367]HBE60699.1 hypothetical protein [Cyanobacteria bacterium UBA11366]HBK66445.1 hypothetical protein [Cyanobacteria bacterium UBA11166]HBR74503.1 hypothetical protein [Cyanobacteria bacterium UBA11159]HBS68301.1 hypothetical protein [Cyanobacteria bacterium UBA11153]HBW91358.1 hypothetical protein [Cyanobacteria bacterium UBA11149]HCA93607.1 hypothetical protein [Cyanobacteria bacterium UBA9226]
MNFKSKVLVSVITIAASGLGFASNAFAGIGVGGVAGSASFDVDATGNVTDVAVSAAVGKDTAYAGAVNQTGAAATSLEAFAAGTGGVITMDATKQVYISNIAEDSARATAQGNSMTIDTFNINADGTSPVVDAK